MLNEAKLALQVTAEEYDAEIASLLMAGANDLAIAGVNLPGTVTFTVGTNGAVTDASTLTDPLVMRALFTYAASRANWQTEARAERFKADYDEQKKQLMSATGYTNWDGETDEQT